MKKRILVAPLNWGLGHASRCVPIVRFLEKRADAEPILASDGEALELLRAEFPSLETVELPSYNIRYPSQNMTWNMARLGPSIVEAVRREHRFLAENAAALGLAGVISDNRYGLFSPAVPSVILTHQLHLKIPFWPLERAANWLLKKALARFSQVWVPDLEGEPNLSGSLAHGPKRHKNVRFLGVLSRMSPKTGLEIEHDVAVILSGPEPQRTILEGKILEQALALEGQKWIVVEGKTARRSHHFLTENIEITSFLTAEELNDLILRSRLVVCRSGYSSLMDLAVLGRPAFLVPTPGQTEQEYLAERFLREGVFFSQPQNALDLKAALEAVPRFSGLDSSLFSADFFEKTVGDWVEKLPFSR